MNYLVYSSKMTTQLIVESTDRNRSRNPDPLSFTIDLPDSYRNVIHIELLDVLLPRFLSQIRNDQGYLLNFVYLKIREFGGNFESTNNKHSDSFTRFCMVNNNPSIHRVIGSDGSRQKRFPVPIARLDKLTIQFLGEDGNPIYVGVDLIPFEKKKNGVANTEITSTN